MVRVGRHGVMKIQGSRLNTEDVLKVEGRTLGGVGARRGLRKVDTVTCKTEAMEVHTRAEA
jgi:hypothetical protein